MIALAAVAAAGPAAAQSTSAAVAWTTPRQINSPSQPLGRALNALAREWGVAISVDASLAADITAPAHQGMATLGEALTRALAGSGLVAVPTGSVITIQRRPREGATLPEVVVTASLHPAREESATQYTVSASSSASKLELAMKETPQSVSVFTEKLVGDMNLTSISEVLEHAPGVTVVENGVPGAGRVQYFARGFAINNFQIDGLMVDGAALGGQHNNANRTAVGMQDPFLFERMDVVRGSTGLTTGSGDPAASLSFVRKRPLAQRQIQANLKYGSWNNQRAELDISTPFNAAGSWRGRLVATRQQGDSHIDRVTHKGDALYAVTELDITPRTTLSAGFTQLDRRIDGAGPHGTQRESQYRSWDPALNRYVMKTSYAQLDRRHNSATQWSYRDFEWNNVFFSLDHMFDNGLRLVGAYNRFEARSDRFFGVMGSQFYLPEYNVASYIATREKYQNDTDAFDVHLSGDFGLLGRRHEFVVGFNQTETNRIGHGFPPQPSSTVGPTVDGPNRNVDTFDYYYRNQWIRPGSWNDGNVRLPYISLADQDMGWLDWNTPRTVSGRKFMQKGLYFSTRLRPTERLQAILGARYGQGEDGYQQRDTFIPYAGLVYELTPRTNVYASYTRIEKPQSPSDGRPVGVDGQFMDPIRGDSVELGFKSALFDNRLNLAASWFTMTQNNVAIKDPAGRLVSDPDYPAQGAVYPAYVGVDGYRIYGLDLSIAGQITPKWNITGGYVFQRQKVPYQYDIVSGTVEAFGDDFQDQFFFPEHSFKLFTTYRMSPAWTVGGGVTWRSTSTTPNARFDANGRITGYQEQRSYALVSLMARYQYSPRVTLGLNVANALDKSYFTNSNIANYGTPRSISASLHLSF